MMNMHQHDTIDRITPTLEPDQPVVMHQNWHHLGFLHWEVPATELQKLIPSQLTIDTFEGKAYIGIVPFTITGVRPVLLPPLPGVSSFHEINVRTYVHHRGKNPGVWFFSLDCASSLAVTAARAAYKLPYFDAEIEMMVEEQANRPHVTYRAHRDDARGPMPAHAHLQYAPVEGPSGPAAPGTLEHFLIERYILYASDALQLYRARVHHQPYHVHRAEAGQIEETLVWAAGVKRGEEAPMRHYAPEVNVKVYPLEKV
jgi:uncharacterized protein YqjF (DUF2071 family)